jgi:ABC-2 type transport system permease protein
MRIGEDLSVYRHLVAARIRGQLQYRASLALDIFTSFSLTFVDFVVVLALFQHLPALGGWTMPEVALLYGLSGLGLAIGDMFIGHIDELHLDIRSGRFDVLMLRPVPTLLQVMASDFALRRLGRILQSAAVLVYALVVVPIPWTPIRIVLLPVGVVCAALVFGATFVVAACLMFWTVGSSEIGSTFTYGGNAMTSYPLNIYGPWLRRALAFAVPLAFVTYFPGLYLLDKPDPLGYPRWFQLVAPLVTAAYLVAAGAIWRFAVRHYRSTGS